MSAFRLLQKPFVYTPLWKFIYTQNMLYLTFRWGQMSYLAQARESRHPITISLWTTVFLPPCSLGESPSCSMLSKLCSFSKFPASHPVNKSARLVMDDKGSSLKEFGMQSFKHWNKICDECSAKDWSVLLCDFIKGISRSRLTREEKSTRRLTTVANCSSVVFTSTPDFGEVFPNSSLFDHNCSNAFCR